MSTEIKNQRFIKFIPGPEADFLIQKPFCFALLTLVAQRARREPGKFDGLEPGEAYIGDWGAIGATRQQYRTALKILVTRKHFTVSETCRNRKKSTTGTTTVGTKVKLLSTSVWDINLEDINHRSNHCPTTEQPPSNHEQERRKNEEDRNKKGAIASEKIVRPSFRSPLSYEEDLKTLNEFSKAFELGIDNNDFSLWLRKHEKEKIDAHLALLIPQRHKIKNHARWMQSALGKDYVAEKERIETNREYAEAFKAYKSWSSLTLTKKYCRDEDTQKDYYFNLPCDLFKQALEQGQKTNENIG